MVSGIMCSFTISLRESYFIMIFIMIVVTIIRNFMSILFLLNYTFRLYVSKKFELCKRATPSMSPHLDILLEYWIEHVTFGLLYGILTFPISIFYRGVPGFATDCACGVWCRWLTICLLYVDPLFGKLILNDSWFAS